MKRLIYILPLFVLSACFNNDTAEMFFDNEIILSDFIATKVFIENEVIACAASDNISPGTVNVYFYPEVGASNFKLYQSFSDDSDNFSSYQLIPENSEPFFQGALRLFNVHTNCKWFVVVFEKDNQIEISTPIRSKVTTRPTVWSTDTFTINQDESLMPKFSWDINSSEENAIFFQVLSTEDSRLISGTYTEENNFQYYKLNNVVLNITQGTPPNLEKGETYTFTVMDVSLDNWVNEVIISSFVAE